MVLVNIYGGIAEVVNCSQTYGKLWLVGQTQRPVFPPCKQDSKDRHIAVKHEAFLGDPDGTNSTTKHSSP